MSPLYVTVFVDVLTVCIQYVPSHGSVLPRVGLSFPNVKHLPEPSFNNTLFVVTGEGVGVGIGETFGVCFDGVVFFKNTKISVTPTINRPKNTPNTVTATFVL